VRHRRDAAGVDAAARPVSGRPGPASVAGDSSGSGELGAGLDPLPSSPGPRRHDLQPNGARVRKIPAAAGIPDEGVSYPASEDDRDRVMVAMAWLVLVISGLLESVWAIALSRAEGFTRLLPSVVFAVALVLSMVGLGYALRSLPVGTAYAVWVGIGASGTALAGMLFLRESASLPRIVSLLLVVAGVVGLKLFR